MRIRPAAALVLILTAFSCKTKETTVERVQVNDSIYQSDLTVKIPDLYYNISIEELCEDSIPQPITKYIAIGTDTLKLWTKNNTLQAELRVKEKVILQKDSIIQSSKEDKFVEKVVVKYRTPGWVWYLVAGSIISLLFSFRVWRYI
jgi:hypothetical protein